MVWARDRNLRGISDHPGRTDSLEDVTLGPRNSGRMGTRTRHR